MKFSRDLCRLLGLGGDGPGEEEMEAQDAAPVPTDRGKDQKSSQAMLNNEEGLDEQDRTRRRAERRRAKRKRQKERKKLERKERMEDASEQEEETAGGVSDSDSEDELKEEERWTEVHPTAKSTSESVAALVTPTQNKSQLCRRMSDEEPEWDISSAFVANAANNIKLKGLMIRATQISRENKKNEGESTEEMKRMGESLTIQGIQMFEHAQYRQAVDMFTEAIFCDPKDHRLYGNRSYCYWFLEQYSSALSDARRSIRLAPDWPKGYFRKGCALVGLKRYSEAEEALEQVLKLDRHCKEASKKLFTCRVLQLMEMGLDEEQSKLLLEKFTTVQAVIASPEAKTLKIFSQQDQSGHCRSLWVGNVSQEVTEKDLCDLFRMFGEIESIKVLHERFCAFINFKNANTAAKALEKLQWVELGGNKLVMRYPDRWIHRTPSSTHRTNTSLGFSAAGLQSSSAASGSRWRAPLNGDECVYWRTGGCFYGDRCRFRHIPDRQGRDKKQ